MTLTDAIMTGHRAGHFVQHVPPRMTGSVAGHDGGVSRVIFSAGWYKGVTKSACRECQEFRDRIRAWYRRSMRRNGPAIAIR
jgi:hypothetical protein